MANYSTLKAAVADVVKTNGTQAITGANLQAVLLSIINSIGGGGYIFAGVATPSTNPGTPDQNVFYIGGAGTYANFGTSVTVLPTNIAVFKYNGTWTCEQVTVENGGVFDISAFKAVGGTLATYADLSAALGTNGANVPVSVRKGGMSIKFVQSSDNKYVQFRCMPDEFTTDATQWQGVDETPITGSRNLVESGGVAIDVNYVCLNMGDVVSIVSLTNKPRIPFKYIDATLKVKNTSSESIRFGFFDATQTIIDSVTTINSGSTTSLQIPANTAYIGGYISANEYKMELSLTESINSKITKLQSDTSVIPNTVKDVNADNLRLGDVLPISAEKNARIPFKNISGVIRVKNVSGDTLSFKFYDSSLNVIGTPVSLHDNIYDYFLIPSGTEYIGGFAQADTYKIEVYSLDNIKEYEYIRNLINGTKMTFASTYNKARFSFLDLGGSILVKNISQQNVIFAFFDSSYQVLDTGITLSSGSSDIVQVPTGAKYIGGKTSADEYKVEITQLINSIDLNLETKLKRKINISDYESHNGILQSGVSCEFGNFDDNNKHIAIPVNYGEKYTITSYDYAFSLIFSYSYNIPSSTDTGVDSVGSDYGTNGAYSRIVHSANTTLDYNVPEGSKYMIVCIKANGTDRPMKIEGKCIFDRLNVLAKPNQYNLNYLSFTPDNEAWTWWYYPQFIHTNQYRDKLFWTFADDRGYSGVAEYDLINKIVKRNALKKVEVDDHNSGSILQLSNGKILCSWSGGHDTDHALHFRKSASIELADYFEDEKRVLMPFKCCYSQVFEYNGTYYVFSRCNRKKWMFTTTTDFETFTAPQDFVISNFEGDNHWYIRITKIVGSDSMVRVAMYSNPGLPNTDIRLGYIDFSNGNVYNADHTEVLGSLGTAINASAFTIIIARNNDDTIRLFSVAETDINNVVIAYSRFTTAYDGVYYTYINGVETKVVETYRSLTGSSYQSGLAFISPTRLVVIRYRNKKDHVELYNYTNGEWILEKQIYEQSIGINENLRCGRPFVSDDKKFILWQRGYFKSKDFNEFSTDVKLYDIENDEILI